MELSKFYDKKGKGFRCITTLRANPACKNMCFFSFSFFFFFFFNVSLPQNYCDCFSSFFHSQHFVKKTVEQVIFVEIGKIALK